MKNSLPAHIYKYVNFESLCAILTTKTLSFKSPKDFNDPFEGKFYNKSVVQHNVEQLLASQPEHIRKIFQGSSFLLQHHQMLSFFEYLINQNGYSCFSKNCDDLLMWAHYSYSHFGACIKFNTQRLQQIFPIIREIKYSNNYEDLNMYDDLNIAFNNIPFRKSLHWKYEQEIRVKSDKPGKISFDADCIEEVILGVNFRPTFEIFEKIVNEDKSLKFKISCMHTSGYEYKIQNNMTVNFT
ncbi:DUF2971 domain-containing protein [Mucilaginibacter sp. X5P1]|uniref:DUF2971 domain-containing protein n=1 Tax=Mucilaginibacter sp. X5P1 TaxID=2723088 RepID=UPI00161C85A3|nr:DUF2971 domain-containing protein [Mucilaginibacter sp. X5P1]MBB6139980.1 hypothetical protein [Mucilaginibacter sp. X5P1]